MNNSELLEIAEEYGTPTFVFDVREFWQRLDKIADIFGEDVQLLLRDEGQPLPRGCRGRSWRAARGVQSR